MSTTINAAHERLEQLQALGFTDEEDCATHQRLLARADAMRKEHGLIEAVGPWCLIQR